MSYDAIVVGSGATGGWAAKELTERGLRVALVEAGPLFPVEANGLGPARADGRQRQPIQSLCYALNEHTAHLFVDDVDNPYSFPEGRPFHWIRSRQVGGRLHVWGRVSPRMSDYEFKAAGRDGVGEDWPIEYADLAPYYDRVERYLGVYGVAEQVPQMPDGVFLAPPPLSTGEEELRTAIHRRWGTRRLTNVRVARRSPDATLAAAMHSGRLTLFANSVASHVLSDDRTGRARGVAFVDRVTRREREVDARVIVLCASGIESTRLLLNSATGDHPDGLGNSSGALGHYLMDHTYGIRFEGVAPQRSREIEAPSQGGYMPAFRNITEHGVDFVRGYGVELQVTPAIPDRSRRLRNPWRPKGGFFWMTAFGEVLPTYENRVSLDRSRTDAWGIPAAHIVCSYGDNELKMARDQFACLKEMLDAAGFDIASATPDSISPWWRPWVFRATARAHMWRTSLRSPGLIDRCAPPVGTIRSTPVVRRKIR